jgi:hypothetical protein
VLSTTTEGVTGRDESQYASLAAHRGTDPVHCRHVLRPTPTGSQCPCQQRSGTGTLAWWAGVRLVVDHEKFKEASKSRGGSYTIELCEFEIEDVLDNGNIVLNFWRRTRDDTGEGGRVVLTRKHNNWAMLRRLKGWRSRPE